jgi:hypothetical protein
MQQDAELIERIDRALEPGELDEQAVDELVDVLTPGPSNPWPDLRVVIHAAQHPVVAPGLKRHGVPDRLEHAIGRALEAVLPLLDIHPYGPTYKLIDIAERELQKERRKHEAVVERLEDESDDEAAVAVVERYLGTEPAPMFVNRLRRRHPDWIERAGNEGSARLSTRLDADEALLDVLRHPPESNEEAVEAMRGALEDLNPPPIGSWAEALHSDSADEQLLAGALIGWTGEDRVVPSAIRCVIEGSAVAPHLAVIVGAVSPERARNAFSQFVAEVSWQNPELPEAELNESRVRAILAARAALPHLDSGLPRMSADDLPSTVPTEQLRQLPAFVDRYWAIWSELQSGEASTSGE